MYGQKPGPFLGLTELVEFCNKNRNFTHVNLIVKDGWRSCGNPILQIESGYVWTFHIAFFFCKIDTLSDSETITDNGNN